MSTLEYYVWIFVELLYFGIISFFEDLFRLRKLPSEGLGKLSDISSIFNRGMTVNGGLARSTIKKTMQNRLIIGTPGSLKTTSYILTELLRARPNKSYIITDGSGEIFSLVSSYARMAGFKVVVFNLSCPDVTQGFNILSPKYLKSDKDIYKYVQMLVRTVLGNGKGDPFWELQASSIMVTLIKAIRELHPECLNFWNLRYALSVLQSNPEIIDALMAKVTDPMVWQEYKAFSNFDEKVRSGVIATCLATLLPFASEDTARITSVDTIDFEEMRKTPTMLFLSTSLADMDGAFAVINTMLFEAFLDTFLRKLPSKKDLSIFCMLDEFANTLTHVPSIAKALATLRKSRIAFCCIIQSYSQLVSNYGQHVSDTIKACCSFKAFLGNSSFSHSTFMELQQIAGKQTFEDEERGTKTTEDILPAQYLRKMQSSECLLVATESDPIITKLRPFFKNPILKFRSTLPPVELSSPIPDGPVPLLPLPKVTSNA